MILKSFKSGMENADLEDTLVLVKCYIFVTVGDMHVDRLYHI